MHEFIRALHGTRKVTRRESPRPITPFGGLAVFVEFLRDLDLVAQIQRQLPFTLRSPNAIPPEQTFTAFLPAHHKVRCLRADSGFFDNSLLTLLEERQLPYLIVARRTHGLEKLLPMLTAWTPVDATHDIGEFTYQLWGWSRPRRFVVIRERCREPVNPRQRWLFDAPGYTFHLLVTNRTDDVLTLWQDYRQRAQIELCFRELKDDLGADGFCLHDFFATEAAFRTVLFTYNLLGEFQRACGMTAWRQPATLRQNVFVCGAALGRSGHHLVLFLSQSWGGLTRRKPLLDRLRQSRNPTAPQLTPAPQAGAP